MSNLRQLFAAYFHEDWFEEFGGSWEAGVDQFARDEPDRLSGAVREIDALLAREPSEEDLDRAIDRLGNCRWPGNAPDAHRQWLLGIRERLTAHL